MPGKDFIMSHPEARECEFFLANIWPERESPARRDPTHLIGDYNALNWRTKRLGIIAYNLNGEIIPGALPVFVELAEFRTGNGIEPENLW